MSATNTSSLIDTLTYVQQKVTLYLHPVLLGFGVTGCCLNVVLLSQRRFRTVSCCTYFVAASIAMLINMTLGIATTIYALNYGDPTIRSLAYCKSRIYILQTCAMIYRWCLTASCFDRYALSSVKVGLRNLAKVHVAHRVVAVLVVVWLVLPVHTLIFYNTNGTVCGILSNTAVSLYHSLFTTINGILLPVAIMATCSLLIHRNLKQKQRRRQQNASHSIQRETQAQSVQRKRDHQVLLMLLMQVIVYVILGTPLMAFYFYSAVSLYATNKSADRRAIEKFAQFISEDIIYLFPVLSFCIYTMASYTFRDELVKLLRLLITCKWTVKNRVGPVTD